MASATFGRKGSTNPIGQPPARRASFGHARTSPAPQAASPADPVADRRAAFLAAERARAVDAQDADSGGSAPAETRQKVFVKERSLATAYLLWFFLGGFSAHRFYLGAPLTGIAQVCLWYVSLMFFMAGNPGAFYLFALGWLWIIGDCMLIPQLRQRANERARRRAEAASPEKVEPVSS